MPLQDWDNIQQIAQDCHRKMQVIPNGVPFLPWKNHPRSRAARISTNGRLVLTVSILMLLSATALYSANVRALGEPPTQNASHPPLPGVVTPLVSSSSV